MKRLISDSALSKWWAEQPEQDYTCSYCGKTGPKAYVQPQHPVYGGGARCTECHNRQYHEYKAKRKAQLAAMPRCEFCNRRGTYRVGAKVVGSDRALLCGVHLRMADEEHAKRIGGMFWLACEVSGWDVRNMLAEVLGRPSRIVTLDL